MELADFGKTLSQFGDEIARRMNKWLMEVHGLDEFEGAGGEQFQLCRWDQKPWPCKEWTAADERNVELRRV